MDGRSRTLRSNSNNSSPTVQKKDNTSDSPVTIKELKATLEDCFDKMNKRVDEMLDKRLEVLAAEIRSNFQAKFERLEEVIAAQAAEIEQLKSLRLHEADLKLDALAFSLHQRMRVEIENNVVMTGIPEADVNENEIPADAKAVLEKLDCLNCELVNYSRVGRSYDGKPRLLKIQFRHFRDKAKAVKNAKRLREETKFHGVYVNPDQTLEERREFRRLRDKANRLKLENPEAAVLLRRGNLWFDGTLADRSVPHRHLFRVQR